LRPGALIAGDAERGEGWRFLLGVVGFDSQNRDAVGITSGETAAPSGRPLRLPEYLTQAPGGADADLRGEGGSRLADACA
jgi:hypothetical protein